MSLRKSWKWIVAGMIFIALAGVGLFTWFFFFNGTKLPVNELKEAREAIAAAQQSEAELYSKEIFEEAEQLYDSAMVYWKYENSRFFLWRDYAKVRSFANASSRKAKKAMELAVEHSGKLNQSVNFSIQMLEDKIIFYEASYKNLPLSKHIVDEHNKAKMFFTEAKIAYGKNKLHDADALYQKANELVIHSNSGAERLLNDFFVRYPKWKRSVNDAIADSKDGKNVILIDKFAKQLFIYRSGKIVDTYDIELGPNWMNEKLRKGDKATPEGNYLISQKKEGQKTKFYKALLVNYPNDDDKARFRKNVANGDLPKWVSMGNLIEIHGHGGKGFDWTDGCIALRDEDMDKLFGKVNTQTRVTIVGSIKPLSEVKKNIKTK